MAPPPRPARFAPAVASVHSTKPQYFFSYAVLGSVVPFLSVLLAERGLSDSQIGDVWAISTLGVIFTPQTLHNPDATPQGIKEFRLSARHPWGHERVM